MNKIRKQDGFLLNQTKHVEEQKKLKWIFDIRQIDVSKLEILDMLRYVHIFYSTNSTSGCRCNTSLKENK